MTKIEKIGKLPVNSRITIDYTQSPVKIDFGYPDPDTSVVRKSSVTFLISMLFTAIIFLILLGIYSYFLQPMIYPHIGPVDTKINQIIISDFQYYTNGIPNGTHYGFDKLLINYTWNNKIYYSKLFLSREGLFFLIPYFYEPDTKRNLMLFFQGSVLMIIFFGLIFLNSFWVAKVFRDTKWGNKKFPELNKKLNDAKYSAEFFPQDFPSNNIIEIPLFKNMYMDYEATDDFAEHLQKISIIEHPFNRFIKKGLPFSKKRKNIIKKPNVYLWKCIFEFKDKPKTGQLILRWT